MPYSPEEIVPALDRLLARMEEFEKRLSALEHHGAAAEPLTQPLTPAPAAPHPLEQLSLGRPAGVMPVVGKVFLGIAGAYLLRAVNESGALPQLTIVPVALAYAGMWLVWAARAYSRSALASNAYSAAAALILAPMLWELTMRFKALTPAMTAGLLVAFVVAASGMAWRRSLTSVVWLPSAFAAAVALGLLVQTRDPLPLALALLGMALVTEVSACRDRWLSLRPVMAMAADAAILLLIVLYTSQDGPSPEYKAVPAAVLVALMAGLFVIYAASVLVRTVALRRGITIFEIVQIVVAFLLAWSGILRATHDAAAPEVGIFCLLAAAGCYFLAFARFDKAAQPRDYHVFSTWAAGFLLAGSFLCFPPETRALWLGVTAVAATFAGVRRGRFTLGFHGALYLSAAALVSGLLEHIGRLLIGQPPMPAGWVVWMTAAFTLACYAIACRPMREPAPQRLERSLRLIFAALAAYTVAAVALAAVRLVQPLGGARLAAVRTLVLCMTAISLAWSGSHWGRSELIWLAYSAIAFCTLKLLLEDLQAGSAVSLAFSLFFYGMAWVLVPRLARSGRKV